MSQPARHVDSRIAFRDGLLEDAPVAGPAAEVGLIAHGARLVTGDAEGKSAELRTLQAEQEKMLQGYRRLNAEKNTVTLPIEVAMGLVVEAAKVDPRATLVPAVGAHDTATIPAIAGKPTGAVIPAAPATPPAAAGSF